MKHSTRRRPVRGLLLATLVAAAMFGPAAPAHAVTVTPAVTAGDLGYPYPNAPDCDEQTGANCVEDQWGFVQGQCHSWVAYRLNELNADELNGETFDIDYHQPPGQEWGNPPNWVTAAQTAGIAVDSTPAPGSVAWWSADGGHVAYVEAVNADGSIQISEMNADYHNGFDFATLTPAGGRWPEQFIHIADLPPEQTTTTFSITANGSSTSSTGAYGAPVTLAESGIAADARGTVVFDAPGHANLCTITLPATSCRAPTLPVGSYGPVSARFSDTDGNHTDSASTNTVSFTVTVAPTPFTIAVNGATTASVTRSAPLTLSESGIPAGATGTIVFNAPGRANLCTITRPAASCSATALPVGSYGPVSAAFTDTDGNYASASSTNTVSFQVSADATSFAIAVNGAATASVARGTTLTFSESGLPSDARGTVMFSTPGRASLCAFPLPATSCAIVGGLPVGTYGPVTATFTDTDGGYHGSAATNTVTVAVNPVAPGAPGAVHAAISSHTATVAWSAPSDNGGAAISQYAVVMSPGDRTVTVAGSSTHASFTNLTTGGYTFKVRAQNAAGAGAWSSTSNGVAVPARRAGYWMLGAGGAVYAFGDAKRFGDAPQPAVAMASRRDGSGYWTVDGRGRVRSFGAATLHGGSPLLRAGESVSTIAATPSGNGYWLFTNRGRAFRYGDAKVFGDMSKVHLNGPIVASAATATGKGYYMVGSDGGVFTFGDARFHGSTGALRLNRPIVGISPTPDNRGYWLVASDGGVFAFDAPFRGSMGHARLNRPVNGLVAFGNGYLMVASDGGIFDFSNKPFFGSLAGVPIPAPIIGVTAYTTD